VPAAETRAAAELVLAAAEILMRAGRGAVEEVRAGRLAVVARRLGGSPAATRLPALSAALAAGDGWLRPLASRIGGRQASPRVVSGDRTATRFGGAVLLLPSLTELSEQAFASLPDEDRALVRLGVIATCFGHAQREAVGDDAVVRMLTGTPSDRLLDEWLSSINDDTAGELAHACVAAATMDPERAERGPSAADMAFLAGDGAPSHAPALATAARCVLDGFARRLLGFRRSSAEYLIRNFLDVGASVMVTDDAIEARIAEPPLALVLRMAGVNSTSFRVPWDEREVTVWLEAE
jgi:hypothetical protein